VVQPGVDVHRLINVVSDSESDEDEDDSDDEPWQPEWYDEWTQNEDMIRRLLADLKIAKTSLRTLKPIQRITKKVRDGAMRHFSASTPILDMDIFDENETDEATFENYVRITEWAIFHQQTVRSTRVRNSRKKFTKTIKCSKTIESRG